MHNKNPLVLPFPFPRDQKERLLKLFEALCPSIEESPSVLRFVGGCVRDALLKKPSSDIDLATVLRPEEVILHLKSSCIHFITPGLSHGTVTAIIDKHLFEITTLREDVQADGRHATVAFTDSWMTDAARRDFTFNALFMDWSGRIYDFFGGAEDLYTGTIRFVGDPQERLAEDYLRGLRFFRFYAHYGETSPDASTLEALRESTSFYKKLSRERIAREFLKLLGAPNPTPALKLMEKCHALEHLKLPAHIPNGFEFLCTLTKHAPDPLLRLCFLGIDMDNEAPYDFFFLRKKDKETTRILLTLVQGIKNLKSLSFSFELFEALGKEDYMRLLFLEAALLVRHISQDIVLSNLEKTLKHIGRQPIPVFPLTGKDLLRLGIQEGPVMGKILRKTKEFWIANNGRPANEQCFQFAKDLTAKLKVD